MEKRVCHRCGAEMATEDSVSHADEDIIVKVGLGNINKGWHSLDLCKGCRKSFAEWLCACKTKDDPPRKDDSEIGRKFILW